MANTGELKRQLGLQTATALIVGETIAIGIFLTPAGMVKSLGSPALVLAVWLIMGLMALCGALCYGELAARYPEAGGGYVYLREAYGGPVAFLYGWMAFLVMDPGLTAALAIGLASYVGYSLALSTLGLKLIAVLVILIVSAINIRGVRLGAWFVRWLTATKLLLLLFILVWGFGMRLGNFENFTPFFEQRAGSAPLIGALAGGLVAAFFSFAGWWDLNKLAGEVRNPGHTLPRALTYGVLIVTAVYVLTSAVFIYLVPPERVTSSETFAAQAGEALLGPAGGKFFSAVVVIAVFGSLVGFVMSAPRVYFAMSRDGVFLPAAASLHPRFGTPARAILLQTSLACLLVALGTFDQIVSYFIFVVVVFIALTVAALFVLRRRAPSQATYRTPFFPIPPLVFLVMITLLLLLLGGNNPKQALLGVAVVALGLPFYYLVFRPRQQTN